MNPVSESPKKLMKHFAVGIEVFLHTPSHSIRLDSPPVFLVSTVTELDKRILSSSITNRARLVIELD